MEKLTHLAVQVPESMKKELTAVSKKLGVKRASLMRYGLLGVIAFGKLANRDVVARAIKVADALGFLEAGSVWFVPMRPEGEKTRGEEALAKFYEEEAIGKK